MRSRAQKIILFLFADTILLSVALAASFLLRFEGEIPLRYQPYIPLYIGITLFLTIPLLFWRNLYSFSWAFVSINEIIELLKTITLSALFFTVVYILFQRSPFFLGFPRSVIIMHHALAFLFLGGLRSAKRVALLAIRSRYQEEEKKKNTLIIGINERSDELIRTLQKEKSGYDLVGILDDDPSKKSMLLHKIKVLGGVHLLPPLAETKKIKTIIIALPDSAGKTLKKTISLARKANITDIKIMPTLYETLHGKHPSDNLRNIQVEDLLGREAAQIETDAIKTFLKGKRILVTGAAGSIGSELCRQISKFSPKTLHLIDYEESNLFHLAHTLKQDFPSLPLRSYIADVRNEQKIKNIVKEMRPHVVFHAAAYKHVPLMEQFPEEAVMTNVFGTLNMARASAANGVENFVLISTDKAVRPISIMGKTKRLAEMIGESLNAGYATNFVSVRFGNVLGSRGSVLPIFQEQIKRRLPLTVTHPQMTRYFMTIPEACLLVLEAGASGTGGEIFILDMGKPVKIARLARELIRLSGLTPDKDIPIVYTKPRPGEKLFEEILGNEEDAEPTSYQKIFRIKKTQNIEEHSFLKNVENLKDHIDNSSRLAKELTKLITP